VNRSHGKPKENRGVVRGYLGHAVTSAGPWTLRAFGDPAARVARNISTIGRATNMKRCFRLALPLILLAVLLPSRVAAQEEKPFQLALFNPIQIYSEDTPILIVRLNLLYGKNTYVKGLDLGFVNHTTSGTTKGLQHGIVGYNEDAFVGWQNNLISITEGRFQGYQSGVFNSVGSGEGFQLGFVNLSQGAFSGFQLSLVNIAEDLYGLQVGLVNIIKSKDTLPFFPIVNWKF
jgi:hypothetical protein